MRLDEFLLGLLASAIELMDMKHYEDHKRCHLAIMEWFMWGGRSITLYTLD